MKLSDLFKKSIYDNPNFSKWFKNSKVVNSSGEPLIVFHGTARTFKDFSQEAKSSTGNEASYIGFWFAENKEVANQFAKASGDWDETSKSYRNYVEGSQVIPVFLSIQNPKVYSFKEPNSAKYEEIMKRIKDIDRMVNDKREESNSFTIDRETLTNLYKEIFELEKEARELKRERHQYKSSDPLELMMDDMDEFVEYVGGVKGVRGYWHERMASNNTKQAAELFRKKLENEGYDGIILKDSQYDQVGLGSGDQFVVFKPTQIKSIFNKTFNPNSSNISESVEIVDSGQNLVKVFKNESRRSLEKLLDSVKTVRKDSFLRGYYDKPSGDYYVWDAFYAIHHDIAHKLGLEYDHTNRFNLIKNSYGETVFDSDEWMIHEPFVKRLGFDFN